MRLAILSAVCAVLGATTARAETLAICGGVAGQAYFGEKGAVSKVDAGWTEDRITGGSLPLSRDVEGKHDIVFVDTTGRAISSINDGSFVIANRVSRTRRHSSSPTQA